MTLKFARGYIFLFALLIFRKFKYSLSTTFLIKIVKYNIHGLMDQSRDMHIIY